MRAISRETVGDLEEGETDIKKAVLLSQNNSKLNREYNAYARDLGYTNVGDMYSTYWLGAEERVKLKQKLHGEMLSESKDDVMKTSFYKKSENG